MTENTKGLSFPFKKRIVNGCVAFRQEWRLADGTGSALDIQHDGHDHVVFDFRSFDKTPSGKIGDKRDLLWPLDSAGAVQLASLLTFLADEYLRDLDEAPNVSIVSSPEKIALGSNWVQEDQFAATQRDDDDSSSPRLKLSMDALLSFRLLSSCY